MKKAILGFALIILLGNTTSVSVKAETKCPDKKGYTLSQALKDSKGIETALKRDEVPNYLAGVDTEKTGEKDEAINSATTFMQKLLTALTSVVAAVAIIFVMINAGKLLISFGSSDNLGKAKKGFLGVVLGLLLIIFAYILVKSVIALVYSGADSSEINRDCVEETKKTAPEAAPAAATPDTNPAPVPPAPAAPECLPRPAIPSKCTTGTKSSGQSLTERCKETILLPELSQVCSTLGVDCSNPDDANRSSIKTIQSKVLGFYSKEAKVAGCANADGIYGECTVEAIKHSFDQKCVLSNGSIIDRP